MANIDPKRVINAQDMGASITGGAVDCRDADLVSLHATWTATGTPVGAFSFEGSNNADLARGTGDWEPITLDYPPTNPSGAAGSWLLRIAEYGYRYIRPKYTRTSGGSGAVLNMWFVGKGV